MSELLFYPKLGQILDFIGTVLAFIALIPYIWQFFTRPKKILCSKTQQVLSLQPWVSKKLQLTYTNKIIEKPSFVVLEITNIGNTDVPSNNFEEPIKIELNPDAEIFDYEVIESKPETLKEYVMLNVSSKNTLEVQPILLNKKSTIVIQFLANNYKSHTVSGLIIGIQKIKNIPLQTFTSLKILSQKWSFLIASAALFAFVLGNMVGQNGLFVFWKLIFGNIK